ncbi:MarR family winged helix-turn-helix transcriptional regulator [Devosia sp. YIM 151766]|uniref:MarR family winged helix-turn-helix transcriptional regulator n=1 Tax=Devosia sp. YIM 151766 TaxID=3017325 RepID=UPI00255C753A|nr:MarR family winged helix-turn-helix transcriptional regulator [Devosia sp. YIM 151766]WIY52697.1 MarR family winged helix-turn-helix transcriptional regulator [Devosia sp. YIM 151766]
MVAKFHGGLNRDDPEGRVPSLGEIGLAQFAPYLINRLSATYNAHLQEALKQHELTTAKMRALTILAISPGLTVNELSELAVVEQSTMSRTLDALEVQGLVRRQSRATDMRVRELHITEAGRSTFAEFWPTLYGLYADLFEGVEAVEYQRFVETLHKVMRNMDARSASEPRSFRPGEA